MDFFGIHSSQVNFPAIYAGFYFSFVNGVDGFVLSNPVAVHECLCAKFTAEGPNASVDTLMPLAVPIGVK